VTSNGQNASEENLSGTTQKRGKEKIGQATRATIDLEVTPPATLPGEIDQLAN
jgi:hypothetical protein